MACRRSMVEHSKAALAVFIRANQGFQSFVPIMSDSVRTNSLLMMLQFISAWGPDIFCTWRSEVAIAICSDRDDGD